LHPVLDGVEQRGLIAEAGVEGADGGTGTPHHLRGGESFEALAFDEGFGGFQETLLRVAASLLARRFYFI
jgi:hypothetical protein